MTKKSHEKQIHVHKSQTSRFISWQGIKYFLFSGGLYLAIFYIFHENMLNQPIRGEEGMFAYMMTNKVEPSNSLLVGSLSGNLQFTAPEHPIFIYQYMAGLEPIVSFTVQALGENPVAFRLWNIMPLVVLAIFGALLIHNSENPNRTKYMSLALFGVAMALPIFGGPLLTIQTDTVYGAVLFTGGGLLIAIQLIGDSKGISNYLLMFISGAVFALGKQEWIFSAILASGLILVIGLLNQAADHSQRGLRNKLVDLLFLLPFSAGLFIGTMISFVADKRNFLGGLDVIRRTMFNSEIPITQKITSSIVFTIEKTPYVIPLIALLILNIVMAYKLIGNRSKRNLFVFANFLSLANILPGYFSSWSGDLRYVVPGAVLTLMLFCLSLWFFAGHTNYLVGSSIILGISLIISIQVGHFEKLEYPRGIFQVEVQNSADCAVLTSSAEAFLDPERVNWVSEDLGIEGALAHLKIHGGAVSKLCEQ